MPAETFALVASYLMCSQAAEVRLLNRSEVEICTSIYMDLKLSFVPGFNVETYMKAPASERAAINLQGYAGYLAWRASNPDLVKQIEANARTTATGLPDPSAFH